MYTATRSLITPNGSSRPPIVFVHGAANSAEVWKYWQETVAECGWNSHAVDLRGHGASDPMDLAKTSMHDYADDVRLFAEELRRPPVIIGWSMGGLVAMMVAASGHAAACVGLAPSTPARNEDLSLQLREGEFGPEEYGIATDGSLDQPAMLGLDSKERAIVLRSASRESRLARDERRRGVVIETLPCPFLIVTGSEDTQWPSERYDDLWLNPGRLNVEDASHWGLVLNRRTMSHAVTSVLKWIETKI